MKESTIRDILRTLPLDNKKFKDSTQTFNFNIVKISNYKFLRVLLRTLPLDLL